MFTFLSHVIKISKHDCDELIEIVLNVLASRGDGKQRFIAQSFDKLRWNVKNHNYEMIGEICATKVTSGKCLTF